MYMIIAETIKSKMSEVLLPLFDAALVLVSVELLVDVELLVNFELLVDVEFRACTKAVTFCCPNFLKPAKSVIRVSLTPLNCVKKTMSTINQQRQGGKYIEHHQQNDLFPHLILP